MANHAGHQYEPCNYMGHVFHPCHDVINEVRLFCWSTRQDSMCSVVYISKSQKACFHRMLTGQAIIVYARHNVPTLIAVGFVAVDFQVFVHNRRTWNQLSMKETPTLTSILIVFVPGCRVSCHLEWILISNLHDMLIAIPVWIAHAADTAATACNIISFLLLVKVSKKYY